MTTKKATQMRDDAIQPLPKSSGIPAAMNRFVASAPARRNGIIRSSFL
jgi:hypothetical protein